MANAVYKRLGQKINLAVELNFVTPEEIKDVNNLERKINAVTDVLSFPYLDDIRGEILTPAHFGDESEDDGFLLGSVCICMQRAKEQAREFGHSLEREVCFLALHGILHCFGYDHIESADEVQMMSLAEKIMNKLNLKRS